MKKAGFRADSTSLRRFLRAREIEAIFRGIPNGAFDRALELGAGDGHQSRLISRYNRRLVSTDINRGRLDTAPTAGVSWTICDAEAQPFADGSFDFAFSSNLLEHLPEPEVALRELWRVLRDDGVSVHTVPNRFWKTLHMALFYPSQVIALAERLLGAPAASVQTAYDNNVKVQRLSFWRRNLWPPPHGVASSNLAEFIRFGRRTWTDLFERSGFEVVSLVDGLPAHSPYRFGIQRLRPWIERAGLSSTTGFVLVKRGHASPHTSWFLHD